MPYHKRMKAPRPEFTTSRLNVGGYGVTVRAWVEMYEHIDLWDPATPVIDRSGWARTTWGTVVAEGSLNLIPEKWRARHYRRVVMGGAGVYRLGLWAFLAARRRGLQFAVPEPGASIEPYRVKMRAHDSVSVDDLQLTVPYVDVGRVAPDGELSWAGRRQRGVYYRRAVMNGAGVYLAGLWALFASGHTREHLQGARGYANTSRNLDAWAEWGHAPPPPPSEVLVSMSYRQIKRAYGSPVANSAADAAREVARQVTEASSSVELIKRFYRALSGDLFSGAGFDELRGARVRLGDLLSSVASVTEAVRAAFSAAALNYLPRGKASRAARRELHAQKRAVLRLLRRMVPRRAVHRPTLRAPRPLYAQATPPSAPLAPPAL